ncbi:MAG: DUF58 domain-containing protein [Bacteroides sp.]|nr:DUF58 domain-containing protein [Bacteroides sp.]MCM1085506.1 DUF58 domain-containing protein [Bacteroides sp.]MCM1169063.1 DUF58 domain-containing protein [Bacteroides sp.]
MTEDFYRQITEPFSSLELLASQVVEGFITGLHQSPFHGFSVEFAEHRQYNQGESVRHVDWKLYGRTDRLYVKKYQEETNLRCHILVDTSSSMYFPASGANERTLHKLGFSLCAAAVLSTMLVRQRDAVGLHFFSSEEDVKTEVKSSQTHLKYLLSELEGRLRRSLDRPELHIGSDMAGTLHLAAERIHKRSLVVVFSDMFEAEADPEALFGALQHLKYRNNEVLLFHVTHHGKEAALAFPEKRYCMVDMESGKEIRLSPAQYRQAYAEKYAAFRQELVNRCNQYRIDLAEADVAEGFVPVLQAYMAKRHKVFR